MSNPSKSRILVPVLFGSGAIVLAVHPVMWLVRTWIDPAYQSEGGLIFALVVAMSIWSVSSPRVSSLHRDRKLAISLLCLTALVRLAGQLLAVRVIGALALVVDVYALGLLVGLNVRKRALSPGWLAVAFAFSLPLERIIQRIAGYGLQHLSAGSACYALKAGFGDVTCEGVRLLVYGKDVLVDLPCSGARGLLLLLLLFAVLTAVRRPSLLGVLSGFVLTLFSALFTNTIRIVVLALGIALPRYFGGIDVMAQPWHDLIGLACLLLGCLPLIVWARFIQHKDVLLPSANSGWNPDGNPTNGTRRSDWVGASVFAIGAVAITMLPGNPIDVGRTVRTTQVPSRLLGAIGDPQPLSEQERIYFTRYGGAATKTLYGEQALLVVSTSSPLRHLHGPEECLTGAGHEVHLVGADHTVIPTAVYRSEAPDGSVYRIGVTFVSNKGHLTTNVSEAVFRWLQDPSISWMMIERISPWSESLSRSLAFDRAVAQAFDLPTQQTVHPIVSSDNPNHEEEKPCG